MNVLLELLEFSRQILVELQMEIKDLFFTYSNTTHLLRIDY